MVECYGNHYGHYGLCCANWSFVDVHIRVIIVLRDDTSSVGVDDD